MVFFYKVYIYIWHIGGTLYSANSSIGHYKKVLFSFCRKIQIGITYFNPFKYFQFSIGFN